MSNNTFNGKNFYTCPVADGDEYRKNYLDSIKRLIDKELALSEVRRAEFCSPEKMAKDREKYREKYIEMIGMPCESYPESIPNAEMKYVGEDDFCKIYRVSIEVMEDFFFYGMLMIPRGVERAPLIIAQHGGGGTPEKCSDMWGENNYGFFVKRALERGFVVFAPQILVWTFEVPDENGKPPMGVPYGHRRDYDKLLKRLGLSLTGLEVFCIRRSLDYLLTLDCINGDNIGMMGLSYGGYFTLHTMAADTRIKAGYSGAAFNDRRYECFNDWGYQNAANTFQDAEIAGLCAPRKLVIDVGKEDVVFGYKTSLPEAERAEKFYKAADAEDRFIFNLWEGGHRFDASGKGFEAFFSELSK